MSVVTTLRMLFKSNCSQQTLLTKSKEVKYWYFSWVQSLIYSLLKFVYAILCYIWPYCNRTWMCLHGKLVAYKNTTKIGGFQASNDIFVTLPVVKPEYYGTTKSIPWLMMPWYFALPGHQQPRYWLCCIDKSLSSMMKDFNYLQHTSVEKWLQTLA